MGAAFSRLRSKAGDALAERQAALALGRVAGVAVLDDGGAVIVEAGHAVDAVAVERARAAGKLGALASSVVTGGVQDLRERAAALSDGTADGRESRTMADLDLYARARRLRGHTVMIDVTDIRGSVVVPAGTKVGEAEVHAAGEAGLLEALLYAASLPQPPGAPRPAPDSGSARAASSGNEPPVPPAARRRLPVMPMPSDREVPPISSDS